MISLPGRLLCYFFVEIFRPLVRASNRADSSFFVDYNGEGNIDIGRKFSEYFSLYSEYQISTNTVRSLLETSANDLFEEGNYSMNLFSNFVLNL